MNNKDLDWREIVRIIVAMVAVIGTVAIVVSASINVQHKHGHDEDTRTKIPFHSDLKSEMIYGGVINTSIKKSQQIVRFGNKLLVELVEYDITNARFTPVGTRRYLLKLDDYIPNIGEYALAIKTPSGIKLVKYNPPKP
ncbi:MAG: hypothetical protein WC631_01470 [Candidatus Paceibacterota bacterium]|jgi:hypothetical protein